MDCGGDVYDGPMDGGGDGTDPPMDWRGDWNDPPIDSGDKNDPRRITDEWIKDEENMSYECIEKKMEMTH